MSAFFLANVTLMGVAASVGLGLVIVMFLRLARRYEVLRAELELLQREHGEATADLRGRIDRVTREVDAVHQEVPPLVSRFKEHIPALETRVEGAEKQLTQVEHQLKAAAAGVETTRKDYNHVHSVVTKREQQLDELNLKELRRSVTLLRGTVDEHLARRGAELDAKEEAPSAATAVISAPATTKKPKASKTLSALSKRSASKGKASTPKGTSSTKGKTEPKVEPKSESKPQTKNDAKPAPTPDDDISGARWIFVVMAVLLGAALLAQWIRTH